MKQCLIVFAREPEEGRVKTRLAAVLGEEQTTGLYQAFVRDILAAAGSVASCERRLAYVSSRKPVYLKKIARRFKLVKQRGRDLGARMHHAFVEAVAGGATRTVIVGTDVPDLPPDLIRQAFRKLGDHDLVLGPSFDGGYYLIGLRGPQKKLFSGIRWGSSCVYSRTLCRAKRLKMRVAVLEKRHDVDMMRDLVRLKRRLALSKTGRVAKWTKKLLGI